MTYTSMANQSGLSQYQQVQVNASAETASPHRLIQMLMEGALQRMAEAKGAMLRSSIAEKGTAIGKASAIVMGLRTSLNFDEGGDLALNLDDLYEFIIYKLTQANLHNDMVAIDDSVKVLKTIKEGWDGIASQVD
jgi:flagellar protein FliS